MDVDREADSGPDAGNTGKADGLDSVLEKALNAAFGGAEDGSDLPPQMVQAKLAEEGKKTKTDAGDKSDREDARAPQAKTEATQPAAAPTGNAADLEAPKHWPADRRKAFADVMARIPPSEKAAFAEIAKAQFKDVESGFTRKSQELSDQAKYAETVRGLFGDHHRQQLAQAGLDEVGALRYLLQLQDYATRDPRGYAIWFMQQHGMTPEHLGHSQATRQPAQQQAYQQQPGHPSTGDPKLDALLQDPAVAELRTQFGHFSQQAQSAIQQLQQQLQAQEREKAQYLHQQRSAHVQGLQSQWQKFRTAQDDHGQLRYPHADALAQQIGAIMETDPEIAQMPDGPDKLDKAYDAALWARPNLRTTLLDQERARAAAETQKQADVQKAKTAARVKPATGAPTVPVKKGGLDAALEAAFAKSGMD